MIGMLPRRIYIEVPMLPKRGSDAPLDRCPICLLPCVYPLRGAVRSHLLRDWRALWEWVVPGRGAGGEVLILVLLGHAAAEDL